MAATYIKSYAHAERLGIKPCDSIIGTVVIPGRKPKIVAMRGSHTSSARDKGKFTSGKMRQYLAYGERFFATNKPMLKILFREVFTHMPRTITQVVYR